MQDRLVVLLFDSGEDSLTRVLKGATLPFGGAKGGGKTADENATRNPRGEKQHVGNPIAHVRPLNSVKRSTSGRIEMRAR
jgi:hypothetical protein